MLKSILALAVTFLLSTQAFALSGGKSTFNDPNPNDGRGGDYLVMVFGDSISAGYNSGCPVCGGFRSGSYAERVAQWVSQTTSSTVRVDNQAVSGFSSGSILREFTQNFIKVRQADFLILNAGGNDFLYKKGEGWCSPSSLGAILSNIRSNWSEMVRDSIQFMNNRTRVATQNIYLPRIEQWGSRRCDDGRTYLEAVMPTFTEANYTLYREAHESGVLFVDTFALLNCQEKDYSRCAHQPGESLRDYQEKIYAGLRSGRIMDINRRTDPRGNPLQLIQGDNLHPSEAGHNVIATGFFRVLGF